MLKACLESRGGSIEPGLSMNLASSPLREVVTEVNQALLIANKKQTHLFIVYTTERKKGMK